MSRNAKRIPKELGAAPTWSHRKWDRYPVPMSHPVKTEDFLRLLGSDYKVIFLGDASMAPSELTMIDGSIDWGYSNDQPGITWLKRIASHFTHSVWLNPIPAQFWTRTTGSYTIAMIRQVFSMYELSVEGLEAAIKKLKVRTWRSLL